MSTSTCRPPRERARTSPPSSPRGSSRRSLSRTCPNLRLTRPSNGPMLSIETLIWLIPALPLAAAIVTALFGRTLGEQSHWPPLFGVGGALVLSLMLLNQVYTAALPHIPVHAAADHGDG